MKTILTTLITLIGKNISKVICSIFDAIKTFFQYKNNVIQNKREEQKQKKEEEFQKKVDNITKDGTIEDLLNLRY